MTARVPGLLAACLSLSQALAMDADGSLPGCLPASPLDLLVRIGGASPPRRARLSGGTAPALQLRDVESGELLWSAGATPPASQLFVAMRAAFAGSLAALDLDGDGLQDRLYAGDLAGRLWRFDLHHGEPAETWITGGVFADFSGAGRAFVAPPDLSMPAGTDPQPWLNIAVGSASLGHGIASNRFYVLRDFSPREAWTAAQYASWQPLAQAALQPLRDLPQPGTSAAPAADRSIAGYYLDIGSSQMLLPSMTVSGHAVLALSQDLPGAGCQIAVRILGVDLQQGTVRQGRLLQQGGAQSSPSIPVSARMQLAPDAGGGTRWSCQLAGYTVEGCEVDTRPRLRWWRRTDAD